MLLLMFCCLSTCCSSSFFDTSFSPGGTIALRYVRQLTVGLVSNYQIQSPESRQFVCPESPSLLLRFTTAIPVYTGHVFTATNVHFTKVVSQLMILCSGRFSTITFRYGSYNLHITQYGSTVYIGIAMVYPH